MDDDQADLEAVLDVTAEHGTPGSGITEQLGTQPEEPIREGKYARVERERRFLLTGPPSPSAVTDSRRITDRYLLGTRLRLRRVDYSGSGACEFKFTQKVPAGRPGFAQGLITSIYLSAAEYDLLAALPAEVLSKTRLSVPPLSIDVFDPPLHGLVMADAEFSTDQAAQSFPLPPAAIAEVTDDVRFTGGSLVRTRRHDLLAWLAEYGIELRQSRAPAKSSLIGQGKIATRRDGRVAARAWPWW